MPRPGEGAQRFGICRGAELGQDLPLAPAEGVSSDARMGPHLQVISPAESRATGGSSREFRED